ncbi:hypothetical protein [Pseudonocardia humida]|uniref:Uncharacterized protein n=1 Tax=Pseudonocardia humida TaxID=2800819 RepID=A0ABT1ACL0_9PSEU|nr:hypothetical protein [Pseudonocardia humida]MCO1660804.1 hypothetical protein [Pseudonocardia humida]
MVGPAIDYVLAGGGRAADRPVVVAAERLAPALGDGAEVIRPIALDELLGERYQGPFDLVGPGSPADPDGDPESWRVVAGFCPVISRPSATRYGSKGSPRCGNPRRDSSTRPAG